MNMIKKSFSRHFHVLIYRFSKWDLLVYAKQFDNGTGLRLLLFLSPINDLPGRILNPPIPRQLLIAKLETVMVIYCCRGNTYAYINHLIWQQECYHKTKRSRPVALVTRYSPLVIISIHNLITLPHSSDLTT